MVDLRSDTVTRPTPEMRRAMAEAEVGDDAYGEDPTVRRLEETYAELVGKEAALFVPSGTMANQLALRLLGRPGTTILAGRTSHIAAFENGAAGALSAQVQTVSDDGGELDPAEVAGLVEAAAHHWPTPSVVCVEDTHMYAGGVPWSLESLRTLAAVGLPVHLDGARLFNAVVATGDAAATIAASATTVWSALTKGLCAPVGSVLAGPADLIAAGRGERQRMGGQMRQAGVIAAAGLVALTTMVDRLAEDHERARRIAEGAADRWPGVDPAGVRTNIVMVPVADTDAVLDELASNGVLAGTVGPGRLRFVTHRDVDDAGVEQALKAIALTRRR